MGFHKIFGNIEFSTYFKKWPKWVNKYYPTIIMLLVKFDLKFEKSIKNKGGGLNLGVPGLFLRKIKNFNFFRKKVISEKRKNHS